MVDDVGSDHRAVARQEIQNAWWNTSLLEDLHKHGGAHDRLLGRFHDHRVTRYDPGRCHSTQDGDRKIPRRNDERDATSPIVVVAFLAGNPLCKLRAAETAHLLRVKAAKIIASRISASASFHGLPTSKTSTAESSYRRRSKISAVRSSKRA